MAYGLLDLRILYYMGSRGDFLASFLYNTLPEIKNQTIYVNPSVRYIKWHRVDQIRPGTLLRGLQYQSICVDLPTTDDILQAAWYAYQKNIGLNSHVTPYPEFALLDPYEYLLGEMWVIWREVQGWKTIKDKFKFLVTLQQLHDIGYLEQFYLNFHGHPPSNDNLRKAEHNIKIQPMPNMECNKLLDLFNFELTHGIGAARNVDRPNRWFTISEFLSSDDHVKYLTSESYINE